MARNNARQKEARGVLADEARAKSGGQHGVTARNQFSTRKDEDSGKALKRSSKAAIYRNGNFFAPNGGGA